MVSKVSVNLVKLKRFLTLRIIFDKFDRLSSIFAQNKQLNFIRLVEYVS